MRYYSNDNGEIRHGDNLEEMKNIEDSSVDSCISDFPYDLTFMGRKWDNTGNFYDWCFERAKELLRIIKPGGYVCIFGHHKTNHRMKCAFEDIGFNIVEEIDWIFLSGFPKNQDIGKLFDKKAGVEREKIPNPLAKKQTSHEAGKGLSGSKKAVDFIEPNPSSELAKRWDGWKTAGLKPSKEIITIFQKPLDGTYINNIEKHGCGAMNIDACRVKVSENDKVTNHSRSKKSSESKGIYGNSKSQITHQTQGQEIGRFPPNTMFDEDMAKVLDEQTGISKSSGGKGENSKGSLGKSIYGQYTLNIDGANIGGLGDIGGGSRMFPIFKYQPKASQSERKLPNGERNPHVTLKPKELIKWLIKLVTPKDGFTIDITSGSCTHGAACEELNRDYEYSLRWLNIELMNSEKEPYCEVGKQRILGVNPPAEE
jgi:site-specific DNA-methyltransferase (adenine-specific)